MMNDFEKGLLTHFTETELKNIQSLTVGLAGAGGLGSNCATALVRSGFRNLVIVDMDTVEPSNLNRQAYGIDQVGLPKVEALKRNLLAINPDMSVRALTLEVNKANIQKLFEDCDAVVEAFDRPDCKSMVIEAFMNSGRFLVAASGLAGCGTNDRIKTRRIKDSFYLVGDLESEAGRSTPPLAPCVNIAASKEADAVLAWALGKDIV